MGRQIKRVQIDQVKDHPLGKTWSGFVMPAHLAPTPCTDCDQTGLNTATRIIDATFYDNEGCGKRWAYDYGVGPDGAPTKKAPWRILGTCLRWCNKITQDEVNHLVAEGRLWDFTRTWTKGEGWKVREDGYIPTAEEVNAVQEGGGMGHDAINRFILVEFRAKKMGVYGLCERCQGCGQLWPDEETKVACEAWEGTPPAEGLAWQVWENVSDGSPVTPAFENPEDLIEHLVKYGDCSDIQYKRGGWSREQAVQFVENGWKPTLTLEHETEETAA